MPKDYRYNPFSDVAEAVSLTELYQIPAVSPYTIRLNEVPEVGDPSTMVVKEVTAISGIERTYGVTFTEVAAVPASGSFRPDYNTGAAGDDDWNTGTLLFAAGDAGKLVEVTYNGLGTLASVKAPSYPAWFTDRGDGSNGDYAPTANQTFGEGMFNNKSVNIPAGVTITLSVGTKWKCLGAFVCHGNINVTASGGAGAPSPGSDNGIAGAAGNGSSGGAGQRGNTPNGYGGAGGAMSYTFIKNITDIILSGEMPAGGGGGSGGGSTGIEASGGAGGNGAGSLSIIAKSILLTGTINAKGNNGGNSSSSSAGGGGGGGGGTVTLIADTISVTGTITVDGGAGGTGYRGSGASGSAGIVYLKELGAV